MTNTGFAFDYNGNATTLRGTTLTYDVENHLTQYGALLTADYNGDGLRAWKQTTAGRTYYLYDGTNPVCELQNNSGGYFVSAVNTFGAAGLLSRNEIGTRLLWYQFDSEGNVAQRLDTAGTVLSTDRYDAWGNLLAGGDTTNPYGYKAQSGYYTDHETGVILCTYRYYDPLAGRWINRDPLGLKGGMNLYGYCLNNPSTIIDPFGLEAESCADDDAMIAKWEYKNSDNDIQKAQYEADQIYGLKVVGGVLGFVVSSGGVIVAFCPIPQGKAAGAAVGVLGALGLLASGINLVDLDKEWHKYYLKRLIHFYYKNHPPKTHQGKLQEEDDNDWVENDYNFVPYWLKPNPPSDPKVYYPKPIDLGHGRIVYQ